MRKGTFRARPSDRSISPFADCIFNTIVGSYNTPRAWQMSSDIAMTWQPGSMMHSTRRWLSTSGRIAHIEDDSFATVSGTGVLPEGSLRRYDSYGSGTITGARGALCAASFAAAPAYDPGISSANRAVFPSTGMLANSSDKDGTLGSVVVAPSSRKCASAAASAVGTTH